MIIENVTQSVSIETTTTTTVATATTTTATTTPKDEDVSNGSSKEPLYTSRVILTTYPGQMGIKPVPFSWGASTPDERGPVIVSRHPNSLKIRNAIGSYGGSYCIYRALAVAIGALEPTHLPNLFNTEPSVKIGPHPQWSDPKKIVSIDPYGHLAATAFKRHMEEGMDVRPSIAITKAHMTLEEMTTAVRNKRIQVDGNVVINERGDLNVVKAAVEPVWYLPGVAERFGIGENTLRRALFEETGGMYPELITRSELKVFLPPIGGLSVYIFGNPAYLSDPTKSLTARVHDECNGSDVFGSDICTCRPYLMYGIEECVKEAQRGGVGLIVYCKCGTIDTDAIALSLTICSIVRKEGRALGEVTKYLVYNARKRQEGGDTAANYFLRTEDIAGVKDMRFQALMPDVLHWLGVTKIDRFMSMSNMKYEAIVDAGIEIKERCAIPDELIPDDSRVEIEAKVASGYFTSGKVLTEEELTSVKGRNWDDITH
ncbi:GTP cyclohydrolase N terminal-domain-containing protein [Syncephalis plumigaleata]|nr:GTP cyclohydrolase N terminal-domain-containing protein [Syncephalis plumigaleata]